MAFVSSSNGFSGLTVKSVPVGADLILIADSAAGNALKQTTITDIVNNNVTSGGKTIGQLYPIMIAAFSN